MYLNLNAMLVPVGAIILSESEFVPQFSFNTLHFPSIVRMRFFPRLPALSISHKIGSDAVTISDSEKNAARVRETIEIIVRRAPQSRVAAGDLLLEDAPRTCSKFIIIVLFVCFGERHDFLCVSALCARGKSRPTIHHTRARIYFAIGTKVICLFCGSTPNFEKSVPETLLGLIMAERCALRGI
jgi:hypothetical protein